VRATAEALRIAPAPERELISSREQPVFRCEYTTGAQLPLGWAAVVDQSCVRMFVHEPAVALE